MLKIMRIPKRFSFGVVFLFLMLSGVATVAAESPTVNCDQFDNWKDSRNGRSDQYITFDYVKKSIIIPVCLRGPKGITTVVDFILDTGSNRTTLDKGVVQMLQLQQVGSTTITAPGGTLPRQPLVESDLTANRERLTRLVTAVQDLTIHSQTHGRVISGLLGNDFLKDYVVYIDYSQKQLGLFDTVRNNRNLEHLATIPFWLEKGFILIDCKFPGGIEAHALFDTGHVLELEVYDDLSKFIELGPVVSKMRLGGASEAHEVSLHKIPWIELAGHRINDITIDVHPLVTPNPFWTKYKPALLGQGILERYILEINYSTSRIQLYKQQ